MQIRLEKTGLMAALSTAKSVVERRNTIPILSNVKMVAADGVLTLTASDLDIEVSASVPAGGEAAWTVPAHLLHEIVRKMPDGAEIALKSENDGGRVSLVSGRSRFVLQSLTASDFPDLTIGETPWTFTVAASGFRSILAACQFAISNEETRYYLNGVYLHTIESGGGFVLRAVATDGHRLARADMPAPQGSQGMPGIIIPKKTVAEIVKAAAETGEISISLSDSKFIAETGNLRFVSKLIDGTFPDYQRVIPSGNGNIVTADRQTLASAADRVSTISSERGRAVRLEFEDKGIVLSVKNPDSGEASDEVAATLKGDPVTIGFNSAYLAEILAHAGGAETEIRLADSGSPTLFLNPQDQSRLFVLMPMRT